LDKGRRRREELGPSSLAPKESKKDAKNRNPLIRRRRRKNKIRKG
jgi:hypothetical protein